MVTPTAKHYRYDGSSDTDEEGERYPIVYKVREVTKHFTIIPDRYRQTTLTQHDRYGYNDDTDDDMFVTKPKKQKVSAKRTKTTITKNIPLSIATPLPTKTI